MLSIWFILVSVAGVFEARTLTPTVSTFCDVDMLLVQLFCPQTDLLTLVLITVLLICRRVYLSVAAAAIYMASQASEVKKTQKGQLLIFSISVSIPMPYFEKKKHFTILYNSVVGM